MGAEARGSGEGWRSRHGTVKERSHVSYEQEIERPRRELGWGFAYGPHKGHALPVRHDEDRQKNTARSSGASGEVLDDCLPVDMGEGETCNSGGAHAQREQEAQSICRGHLFVFGYSFVLFVPADAVLLAHSCPRRLRTKPASKTRSTTAQSGTERRTQVMVVPHFARMEDDVVGGG